MALLVNPSDRALAQSQAREVLSAAHERAMELHILNASSERDFDAVFADLKRLRVGGLVIGAGSVFVGNTNKLAALTVRHSVPAIYQSRSFAAAGGLMSYGSDIWDGYRLAGIYRLECRPKDSVDAVKHEHCTHTCTHVDRARPSQRGYSKRHADRPAQQEWP